MVITNNDAILSMINSPVRKIGAKVELYEGSTLVQTFQHNDALKSFSITRVGEENKFFGFGICQKLSIKLIDKDREIDISTANSMKVDFNVEGNFVSSYPIFYVSEVRRDENTNELSITAYDALYKATQHTVAELELDSYTVREFATACASILGLTLKIEGVGEAETCFDTDYPTGANFEDADNIQIAIRAIAEITQTVYYANSNNELVFKRLDKDGPAVATIGKDKYITLESKTSRRLGVICHATELGDNVSSSAIVQSGSTQYVRDNPFWDLRLDVATLVENAITAVGGLTINQFSCSWRGNFLLEIGDKIELVSKDDKNVCSFLLDDVINYDGYLSEESQWKYSESDETASNPSTLGDALNQTFAKVDKVNKQVDIVVSDVEANKESISTLKLNTNTISATVSDIRQTVTESVDGVNREIAEISKKVSAQLTPEQVQLQINNSLDNGVHKVETTTGFTFNDEGLRVSKSGTEMSTLITEDGMKVYRDNTAVLTANNMGVDAVNLHATTYLIIGTYSRLEDWEGRTGCFWIGG